MLVALDFESQAIEPRPMYPPRSAGLAIMVDDGKDKGIYHAWDHLAENNCTRQLGHDILAMYLSDPSYEYVFHNAPFDCSIIEEEFGIKVPWERVHDTMLLAFLHDPYGELSLKPLAERHLGEPPTERDAVREWLVKHGVVGAISKQWGAHIAKAPGKLVGTYAIGDVRRTLGLYHFYKGKGL